ncbi:MAG: hypothetical protein C4331_08325, partial [Meiothermus sp.]
GYINEDEIAATIDQFNRDNRLSAKDRLNFHRFESRVYAEFDPELYGPQFPLALAVRSSSIPGIFEPVHIRRSANRSDLFVDGGVADNFALDIAANPQFGNCEGVLGISLTNLGYRLPNPNAAHTVLDIAVSSLSYMMDAMLDQGLGQNLLAERRITVINALSNQSVSLTNTARIGDLVKEGEAIAAGFRQSLQKHVPSASLEDVFRLGSGPQAYLSRAAIVGPEAFKQLLDQEPKKPSFLRAVFLRPILTLLGRDKALWVGIYGLVFACAFAAACLLVDLLMLRQTPLLLLKVLGWQGGGALALILLLRLALWIWRSRVRQATGGRSLEVRGEALNLKH